MPTPSIQTLRADAQQVLNLDSISAVRSVVAASLANANSGTPLNPNLTTQQLWNEFYQIVTQPKSDIESIIANQLMKFLYAPPAPGGAGADKQVIFNDGGVLAGDPQFLWNKTTNLLTVTGAATITGDLTVATDRLKVVTGSTAIQTGATTQLQVGTTSWPSTVIGKSGSRSLFGNAGEVIIWNESAAAIGNYSTLFVSAKTGAGATTMGGLQIRAGIENASNSDGFVSLWTSNSAAGGFVERYKIDSTGVATWSNVGGVAGTAMTLNSTGLGVGDAPAANTRLTLGSVNPTGLNLAFKTTGVTTGRVQTYLGNTSGDLLSGIEGSTAGQTLTGSAAYSGFIGTFTNNPFYLVSNGLIRATIDSSGNVGIGVTPSAWSVYQNTIQKTYGAFWTTFTDQSRFGLNCYYNGTNWIYTNSNYASIYEQSSGQHRFYTAPSGTAGNAFSLSQAMTLDASGNLLVGTTSQNGSWNTKLTLSNDSGTTKWAVGPYLGGVTNFLISAGASAGVYLNGTAATSWTSASDERLKDIIEPISNAIAKVGSLRAVIGKFKFDENNTRKPFLIAQDIQAVLPEAVDASNPEKLGVAYTDIIPLLVAAIKELTAEVNALKNA